MPFPHFLTCFLPCSPLSVGVYSAAFDRQTEWVVIKGISHYADGGQLETEEWRRFSSAMAASVVNHMMKEPDILKDWPHYEGMKRAQIYSGNINITVRLAFYSI